MSNSNSEPTRKFYFLEYGCSIHRDYLVVSAKDEFEVNRYGCVAAEEEYYSYNCNYLDREDYPDYTDEEFEEAQQEEMENDINWAWDEFDPTNEDHIATLREQDNKPFEI